MMTNITSTTGLDTTRFVITSKGALGYVGEFPTDKRQFSEVIQILTDNYLERGGKITYGDNRKRTV